MYTWGSWYISICYSWVLRFFSIQPYYRYADSINPDVWFEPTEVTILSFCSLWPFLLLLLSLCFCFPYHFRKLQIELLKSNVILSLTWDFLVISYGTFFPWAIHRFYNLPLGIFPLSLPILEALGMYTRLHANCFLFLSLCMCSNCLG